MYRLWFMFKIGLKHESKQYVTVLAQKSMSARLIIGRPTKYKWSQIKFQLFRKEQERKEYCHAANR